MDARVELGRYVHAWTVGTVIGDGASESTLIVDVPAAAFMLDLQDTAVAELLLEAVQVRIDDGSEVRRTTLEWAGVAWTSGRGAVPRLFTGDEAATEAPAGIIGRIPVGADEPGIVFTSGVPGNVIEAAVEVSP